MSIDIRPWQPGDEAAILTLFETTFGRPLTESFWRWRFQEHPAGGPMIMLAWDDDRLAAHYAASHSPLVVDGQTVPAALSMTTMTHPDYRGRRLFEATASALYEQINSEGIQAIWGFPNINSTVAFRRRLGWSSIADVAALHQHSKSTTDEVLGQVIELPAIDERFDGSFADNAEGIRPARDASTLRWRVDRNPSERYTRLVVPDGERLAGYAILKNYRDEDVDILELEAIDEEVLRLLVATASHYAYERSRPNLHTWCLPRDRRRLWMERTGFVGTGPVTYFGGRNLGSIPQLDDPRLWQISMLDSDVY